VNPTASTFNNN